jgi:hypothetical protein
MKDYSKGKIYKVVSKTNDKVYIGSTIQLLCERMSGHRKKTNDCSSVLLGDINDCYIILVVNYPCNNKEELRMEEERHYQLYKKNGFDVVNQQSAYTTKEQKKEQIKKWREDNKDKIKEQLKKYQLDNKDKIKEQKKKYQLDNKEKFKEQKKKYQLDNKEKIKETRKEKITCECGCIISKSKKSRHIKSKKHINLINK